MEHLLWVAYGFQGNQMHLDGKNIFTDKLGSAAAHDLRKKKPRYYLTRKSVDNWDSKKVGHFLYLTVISDLTLTSEDGPLVTGRV